MAADELAESFAETLRDLSFNSKPHISMLTMLAEENVQNAPQIVKVIEAHLQRVKPECKLPTMYLIDSIVKNVGHSYASLFVQNLVSTFCGVFEKVDEKVRMQLFKLRQTWADIFPNKKLYAIDMRVKQLDPAWPVTAQPPQQSSIHVNPKFLKQTVEDPPPAPTLESASRKLQDLQEEEMRKQLLAKQQELLRLQRQKLELELIQTQVMVEEQKRQLIIKEQQVLRVQQHADAEAQKALQQQQQRHNLSMAAALVAQVAKAKSQQKSLPVGPPMSQTNADVVNDGTGDGATSTSHQMPVQLTLPHLSKNKLTIDSNSVVKTEPIGGATTQIKCEADSLSNFESSKPHVVASSSKVAGPVNNDSKAAAFSPKAIAKVKVEDSTSNKYAKSNKETRKSGKKSESPKKKKSREDKGKASPKSPSAHKTNSSSRASSKGSSKPADVELKPFAARGRSRSPTSTHHLDKDERPSKRTRRSPRKEKENDVTGSLMIASDGPGTSKTKSLSDPNAASVITAASSSSSSSSAFLSHKGDVDLRTPIDLKTAAQKDAAAAAASSRGSSTLESSEDEPPIKKSKSDESDLDDIFSGKDQDYRQLGRPVPRLSPIGEQSSWAQYKASRPEEFKNPLRSRDNLADPFGFGNQDLDLRQEQQLQHQQHQQQHQEEQTSMGRLHPWARDPRLQSMLPDRDPRMVGRRGGDVFRPIHGGLGGSGLAAGSGRFAPRMLMPQQQIYQATQESDPNIPRALMFDRGAEIMRQADQQLRTGQLTIEQHAEIMEQLAKLYELQRMRHMQREQHVRDTVIFNRKLSRSEESSGQRLLVTSPEVSGSDNDREQLDKDAPSQMNKVVDDDTNKKADKTVKPQEVKKEAEEITKTEETADQTAIKDVESVIDVSSVPLPPTPSLPSVHVAEKKSEDHSVVSAKEKAKEDEAEKEKEKDMVEKMDIVDDPMEMATEIEVIVIDDEPSKAASQKRANEMQKMQHHDRQLDMGMKRRESRWSSPLTGANAIATGPPPPSMRQPPMPRLPPTTINTVMIDDKPREVRFIEGKAIVVLENDDIREIGFRGPPQEILFDKQVVRLAFGNTIKDFEVDGMTHTIRFGAPTREVIVDGVPYAAVFGGPPIIVHLRGKQHELRLSGPTPEVFFGDKPRHDLLPLLNLQKSGPPPGTQHQQQRPDSPMSRFLPPPNEFGGREGPPWRGGPPGGPSGRPPAPGYMDEPPFRRGGFHPSDRRSDWMRDEEFHRRGVGNRPDMMCGRHGPDDFYDREARHSPYRDPPPNEQSAGFHPRFAHPPFRPNGPPPPPGMPPPGMPPGMHPRFDGPPGGPPHHPPASHPAMVQYPIPFGYRHVAPPVHNDFNFGPPNVPHPRPPTMVPPPPMPVPPPSQINVSELFSKLVATGIIPHTTKNADKVDTDAQPATRVGTTEVESGPDKIPQIELSLDSLRVRQATVVAVLYCGIQCSSCGVRFTAEQTDKYAQHLDWHFRQNRREKGTTASGAGGGGGGTRKALLSRRWHYDLQDWVQFEEFEDLEERARSFFELQASEEPGDAGDGSSPSVPAGENEEDKKCCVCLEPFELYWDEDQEEWHFKDAVRRDEKNYHPLCCEDIKERHSGEETADETMVVDAVEIQTKEEQLEEAEKPKLDDSIKKELSDDVKVEIDAAAAAVVKVEPMDAEPPAVSAAAEETIPEEPEMDDQSLSIFNVLTSSYSVPPGIGLEVEPEEKVADATNPEIEETIGEKAATEEAPASEDLTQGAAGDVSNVSIIVKEEAEDDGEAELNEPQESINANVDSEESDQAKDTDKDLVRPLISSSVVVSEPSETDPAAADEVVPSEVPLGSSSLVEEPMELGEVDVSQETELSTCPIQTQEPDAASEPTSTTMTASQLGLAETQTFSDESETKEVLRGHLAIESAHPSVQPEPAPRTAVTNEMASLTIVDQGPRDQEELVVATCSSPREALVDALPIDHDDAKDEVVQTNSPPDAEIGDDTSCPEVKIEPMDAETSAPPEVAESEDANTADLQVQLKEEVKQEATAPPVEINEDDVALKESSDVIVDFAFETSESPVPKPEKCDDGAAEADNGDDDDEEEGGPNFTVLPPVMRGTELSGLCSLM